MKMEQAIAPVGESRSNFELFKGLAESMGMGDPWPRPVSDYTEEVVRNVGRAVGNEEKVWEEFSRDGITRLLPRGRAPSPTTSSSPPRAGPSSTARASS